MIRGLDLANIEQTTREESDAHLADCWGLDGPIYDMYASSLMLDYGGPSFIKHHTIASFETEGELSNLSPICRTILRATHVLSAYVMIGWETGIRNEFNVLRRAGISSPQAMEVVLFSQLYAGIRGLGHTYHAVGDFLGAYRDPTVAPEYPPGWEHDPEAFKAGLDYSVDEMTAADRENLAAWYERTIGYVPSSIAFGLRHNADFLKANRGKWETAIQTLPKQFAPHLMLRQNMIAANVEGVRESVLLAKAWGMSREIVMMGISGSVMYFNGIEGYYTAAKAADDILENWDGVLG